MGEAKQTPEQILPELREAKKALDLRLEEEQAARRRTTDARVVYNGLCKRMDEAVRQLKAEAPWDTEWHQQLHGHGEPA